MEPFVTVEGAAAPLLIPNVDTDVITPMNRLVGGNAHPLHHYAFEPYRYVGGDGDLGEPNPEFTLNRAEFANAPLLITGENFGCGSSRETAPAALGGLGIRCLIGSSFGEIFFNNCFQRGLLAITLPPETIASLAAQTSDGPFRVDLVEQRLRAPDGTEHAFEVNPLRRKCLLEGLDDLGLTLQRSEAIDRFQQRDRTARPWIYPSRPGDE
jgi:3-isopropylmalate/(R)-2-methylmalate dehydratase small subunit